MLTKFETKSNTVNGLTFHPKRPWILASLHSGVIQLWDYRMGTLIDRFEEHEGPVRGVHFHSSRPLFVSGGDDYKIKVWNYETHRCLFTLHGHLKYIRTVQFHHENPWIVSASDDQTIRIWNWQSRTCISVLTDHSGSVMCVSFHPKEDLLVSASLDKTVRVWDIGALRENKNPILKQKLTGHGSGVNWASFHPTKTDIVSGAKDRQVMLWQKKENETWKVKTTLEGHVNTVSCAMFQEKYLNDVRVNRVVSTSSKDKSIRVWDISGEENHQSFCCEHDRFWTLAVHPEINLLAAGHDSGMIVFKLGRERPAFTMSGDSLLYAKDRSLWLYTFSTQSELQASSQRVVAAEWYQSPRTLSYSPTGKALVICSDLDGGSYELYIMPDDKAFWTEPRHKKSGTGSSAIFIDQEHFAVLEKRDLLAVKKRHNVRLRYCSLPFPTDAIFYAGNWKLLCRSEGKVAIIDLNKDGGVLGELETLQQRLHRGERQTTFVRNVVWSNDMESVALLCKHTIIIASENLVHQCTLDETKSVKSGAWDDDNGVFIYTTLSHIKYCLPNGESGIIKTLDAPIYITKVTAKNIFCLDRDGKVRIITIDATEYIFKLSLLRKKYDHVMSMIRNSQLCGQAMVAYLQQKGFPGVALDLAEDERIRFYLALESGNINAAVTSATQIDDKDLWYRLEVEALRQGKVGAVEFAYQKTKNFERLSFLYFITGNLDKLSNLMKIAEVKNNVMGQFQNALYLGDVKERVKILENAGHLPLAYITASVHGLNDIAERLATQLGGNVPLLPEGKTPSLLMPPTPVMCCGGDWPIFEGGLESAARRGAGDEEDDCENEVGVK